ncbi:hypothetical protein E4L96_14510 [Massilia arenosa]|uniref:Alpha/beta hydrolase domain-containing protein n=1 Tax=Zemynaea arenosa TaxID=2561931 RepID=A0A4Y9SCP4_9BURK|nr:alpha/beta hydrolase domain-containing protein [Massilia arenosa]TFW17459.1 hypothetical protein E4L96_14510 [Massilia arenosa]
MRTTAGALGLLALASCAMAPSADRPAAEIEQFEVLSRSTAFDGKRFEDVGQYETVVGVAHVRVNPAHPANRIITDIDKATGPDGWVHFKTDVVVLRPRDGARASQVMLVDVPNRGNKLFNYMVNEGQGQLDHAGADGVGYTMRRGYSMVWIGWQGDIALARDGRTVGTELPVARDGGQPITSWSVEEKVFDDVKPVSTLALTYPAVSGEAEGHLTVRARAGAPAEEVTAWRWLTPTSIEITRPRGYDAGAIYEFRYQARDPKVMGLGFAALRDVSTWLKSGAGAGNPLADIKPSVSLAVGVSQSGRVLRDFIWYGFNANPAGGRVFDGAMPLIAGGKKSYTNYRFALPGRNSTQHNETLTPGDQFPFTYAVTRDPLTGRTDGIFARCQQTATCPRLMHVDSSTEFWQGRASLVVTDGAGKDVALPPEVRAYLMSSTQHVYAKEPTVGICKYPSNTAQQAPLVRALVDDLVAWVREGSAPPPTAYPTLKDVRLAAPTQDAVGFPVVRPNPVDFPQVVNGLAVVDYSAVPWRADPAKRYRVLVPMVDEDGHDIAGVRLPDVAVPLATHTGWNVRRALFAEGELCGLNGLTLPLPAQTTAGDPRRPLSQRYASRLDYAKAIAASARDLRDRGLLLQEDVDRYIDRARTERRLP